MTARSLQPLPPAGAPPEDTSVGESPFEQESLERTAARVIVPDVSRVNDESHGVDVEAPGVGVEVELLGLSIRSAFQPILSTSHARIVGYEALLRAHEDGAELPPAHILERLEASLPASRIHHSCTQAHLANFALGEYSGWLFLNASPGAMSDRDTVLRDFGRVLRLSGIPPERVVVEIIETKVHDEHILTEAVTAFRELGCLVAIDDFGAGESNFERIWRLRPDLVKIDRAMIAEAEESAVVRRILPGLVSLLHEAGCLVVIEGIETREQALLALGSDADFVQGYYFARPEATGVGHPQFDATVVRRSFDELNAALRQGTEQKEALDLDSFHSFTGGFEACVFSLEEGADIFDACSMFLAVAGVQRVYLLDELGYLVGSALESRQGARTDPRLLPCADSTGSNWYRRSYFQAAIKHPFEVQISRPYLSIRDAQTCVTLSVAFEGPAGWRVFCADLDHDPIEPISERMPRDARFQRL